MSYSLKHHNICTFEHTIHINCFTLLYKILYYREPTYMFNCFSSLLSNRHLDTNYFTLPIKPIRRYSYFFNILYNYNMQTELIRSKDKKLSKHIILKNFNFIWFFSLYLPFFHYIFLFYYQTIIYSININNVCNPHGFLPLDVPIILYYATCFYLKYNDHNNDNKNNKSLIKQQ